MDFLHSIDGLYLYTLSLGSWLSLVSVIAHTHLMLSAFCFAAGLCVCHVTPPDVSSAGGQCDRPAYGLLCHAACLRPHHSHVPPQEEGHRRDLAQVLLLPGLHDHLPVLHVCGDPASRLQRYSWISGIGVENNTIEGVNLREYKVQSLHNQKGLLSCAPCSTWLVVRGCWTVHTEAEQ